MQTYSDSTMHAYMWVLYEYKECIYECNRSIKSTKKQCMKANKDTDVYVTKQTKGTKVADRTERMQRTHTDVMPF